MPTLYDPETGEWFEVDASGKFTPVEGRFEEGGRPRGYGAYVGETMQDFGASAGAAFNEYGRTAQTLTGMATREDMVAQQQAQQAALEGARQRSPTATMLGNYVPEAAMALADRGKSLMVSAALGGAEGLRFQDMPEDQFQTGGISAAAAAAFPLAGRVWNSAMNNSAVMKLRSEASRRAKAIGLPVTAGDVTGQGSTLKKFDDVSEDLPLSNMLSTDPGPQGQAMLNQAANETIGETGDQVTKENLRNAAGRLKEQYKVLGEKVGPATLSQDQMEILTRLYPRMAKRQGMKSFQGLIEGGTGEVSGSELLELHKLMVRQADLAGNVDDGLATDIINEVIKPLDNMIEGRLGADGADAWRTAREQYRFHHLLTEGQTVTGVNVNPRSMNTKTRRNMPEVVRLGEGERLHTDAGRNFVEMNDLAADPALRAGNQSGTGRRLGQMGGILGGGMAAVDLAMTGGSATTFGAGAGILGNSAYQAASRKFPFMMGDIANQAGRATMPLGNPGQLLDTMEFGRGALDAALFPFIGTENDIPNQ